MNDIKRLPLLTMFLFLQGFGDITFVNSVSSPEGYFAAKLNNVIDNYDKKIRPNINGKGPPIHILVEMKIISFGPINEVKQEYNLDIFFRQWWWDRNLVGVLNDSLTMAIDIGDLIWKPDTYFVNAKDPSYSYVTKETMRVIIKPDGNVYYSARINLKVNCIMDFTDFPIDTQMCPLFIESYSYTTQEVFYSWYNSKGSLVATQGVEWVATNGPIFKLEDVQTEMKDVSNNSKGAFSKLTAVFRLRRRQGYYYANIYIPSAFLVAMTWVTFWIPASAYPARVTVCVTSFLTTVLIMANAGKQLPRVSYLKAIDWYLIGNALFVFLSLTEYVFVLNLSVNISILCKAKFKEKVANMKKGRMKRNLKSDRCNNRNEIPELCSFRKRHEESYEFKLSNGSTLTETDLLDGPEPEDDTNNNTEVINKDDKFWYEKQGIHHPVDFVCRLLFPLSYTIFLVLYAKAYDLL